MWDLEYVTDGAAKKPRQTSEIKKMTEVERMHEAFVFIKAGLLMFGLVVFVLITLMWNKQVPKWLLAYYGVFDLPSIPALYF